MKTLVSLFSFALAMTILSPLAFAAPPGKSVNAIRVDGLGNYLGKYITAFYAVGRPSAISTQRDQMTLRAVKWQKTLQINQDSVTFPPTPVLTWNGNQMPYNFIVFAVHVEKEIAWVNANGTLPEGSQAGTQILPMYVDSLKDTQVDELSAAAQGGTIVHFFNSGY